MPNQAVITIPQKHITDDRFQGRAQLWLEQWAVKKHLVLMVTSYLVIPTKDLPLPHR